MKEILDIIVWGGFIFILFIFIRGMNETQVQKHLDRLEENEKKQKDTKGQDNND
jgi:arginine exporter protein ArgO